MSYQFVLTLVFGSAAASLQAPDLRSPEATLRTFIDARNRRDSAVVYAAYALELTHQRWEFSGSPIESFVIKKRSVFDSTAVRKWNAEGIIPPAKVGDVELQVELRTDGRTMMVSYDLRSFGGRWRIYAHSAWGAP